MTSFASTMLRFLQESHEGHDHNDEHDYHASHDAHEMEDELYALENMEMDDGKPWREVFFSSLLVNLASLSGVIIVAFAVLPKRRLFRDGNPVVVTRLVDSLIIPSFAAGALLATCVFLIIPESIELIGGGHAVHEEEGDSHEGHDDHRQRFLESLTNGTEQASLGDDGDAYHEDHSDDGHSAVAWKFGVAFIAGYLLPLFLGIIFAPPHDLEEPCETCEHREAEMTRSGPANSVLKTSGSEDGEHCCEHHKESAMKEEISTVPASETTLESQPADANTSMDVEDQENPVPMAPIEESDDGGDEETASVACSEAVINTKSYDYSLIASILLGDFFHNFTDGIFLGNAWLFCERHVAYAMVAATLYHEFAQEFADFCLLTHHCGMKVSHALVLNFVSGTSVMMGGFLILAIDLTTEAMGVTLAISAGVYMYVATSECLPRIQEHQENKTFRNRMIFVLFFALGVVPIGLVLINHSHGCE